MATKKAIELDSATNELLKAMAAGDLDSVDLDKLQELAGNLGLKVVTNAVAIERYSRKAKVLEYALVPDLTDEDREKIEKLPTTLGQGKRILDKPAPLTSAEIDLLMEETLVERPVADVLKGTNESRRQTLFNAATYAEAEDCTACNATGKDGKTVCATCDGEGKIFDPYAKHTFASPKHGHKFTVTNQERGGDPDYTQLESILDDEVWESITTPVVTRKVDEKLLAQALSKEGIKDGSKTHKVTMKEFENVITEKKVSRMLRVDPLKEGDAI